MVSTGKSYSGSAHFAWSNPRPAVSQGQDKTLQTVLGVKLARNIAMPRIATNCNSCTLEVSQWMHTAHSCFSCRRPLPLPFCPVTSSRPLCRPKQALCLRHVTPSHQLEEMLTTPGKPHRCTHGPVLLLTCFQNWPDLRRITGVTMLLRMLSHTQCSPMLAGGS